MPQNHQKQIKEQERKRNNKMAITAELNPYVKITIMTLEEFKEINRKNNETQEKEEDGTKQ